ncbi:MAG: YeeE/YedE family protein [Rhodospirillales bacterium]|nr:YeeE/YedE family protein [Rhodospirillales bacterium]
MTSQDSNSETAAAGPAGPEWLGGFREDYNALLVDRWSPYMGGIVLVAVSLGLMMNGLFWGVFGGLRLWGDWFNNLIGLGGFLGISEDLASPLMHRISLMNITLLFGACAAAMLAGSFRIARARNLDYLWGAVGGTFMGVGASLAGGCTIGGFFTPSLFSATSAWVSLVGLMVGAVIGLKALFWTMGTIKWGTKPPKSGGGTWGKSHGGLIGTAIVVLVGIWVISWFLSDDDKLANRAVVLLAGFALGFVLHRSRFCIARAIREPFMTGDGTMTKALILSLVLGIPLASFLIQQEAVDPLVAIPARFWIGSAIGGVLFGIGMIFGSGCGSGSLWRAAEGQVKLWITVFFFAWSGSVFNGLVKPFDLLTAEMNLDLVEETKIGYQAFMPEMLGGWTGTYVLTFAVLAVWYAFVRYNETTERFTAI